MPYRMTVEVHTEGAPTPTRSEIVFDLPAGATDEDATTVAKGIRRGFTDAFSARVKVVGLQQIGLARDVEIGTEQVELSGPRQRFER